MGAPTLEPDFGPVTYFGALVGRFANRIAHGRFALAGQTYQVPAKWLGRHSLHGGPVGTGQKVWRVMEATDDSVRLELDQSDADLGFPGTMKVSAEVSLPGDGTLALEIAATSDAPTPCSFAHHGSSISMAAPTTHPMSSPSTLTHIFRSMPT